MPHIPLTGRKVRSRFYALRDELFLNGREGPDPDSVVGSTAAYVAELAATERLVLRSGARGGFLNEGRLSVAQGYLYLIKNYILPGNGTMEEVEELAGHALELVS